MDLRCFICSKKMGVRACDISRHVKKHNFTFNGYISKYYKLIDGEVEKCSFCENDAVPILDVDHNKKLYNITYKGYSCNTQECKNNISLDILGIDYDSKKYEKIGSKKEYLSKLYRIDISSACDMKYKTPKEKFNCSLEQFQDKYGFDEGKFRYDKRIEGITKNSTRNKFPCTLENFIRKYGVEKGTDVYNKRCERISYTSSLDFFIRKYGYEEGNKVWKNKFKQIRVSKSSKKINKLLDELNIKYEIEKNINGKFIDYYLYECDICIEYFGDYWHMNPKLYESNEYNKRLKKTAIEVWNDDNIRIDKIKETCGSIIIIWESSKIDITILEKTINNMKNIKTVINL